VEESKQRLRAAIKDVDDAVRNFNDLRRVIGSLTDLLDVLRDDRLVNKVGDENVMSILKKLINSEGFRGGELDNIVRNLTDMFSVDTS
jgi:hypothetical protein